MKYCIGSLLVWVLTLWLGAQSVHSQPERESLRDGTQELTRGPIHEGFAHPVVFDPEPGVTVAKKPPEPIEELPPEQRPAGDNVEWISGYWSWADERSDYIWVSGIWRALPPGQQWVPGYWSRAQEGYRWVSGFWSRTESRQVEYLPPPPDSLEEGPSSETPSATHFWAPGCWYWQETRYVWRPGYWMAHQPNWVWMPAHYVWTPRGCVFNNGHWDHTIVNRGLCFAPVHFDHAVYSQPRFVYTPTLALASNVFVDHFFSRPRYHHYYFGDYYAQEHFRYGIYPSFSFHYSRHGYDPIFAYHVSLHGGRDRDWADRLRDQYRHRRENEALRPAHTLAAQRAAAQRDQRNLVLAQPFSQLAKSQDIKLQVVARERREEIVSQVKESRQFQSKRVQLETATQGREAKEPQKVELPKAPVKPPAADRDRNRRADREAAPPPPEVPKPDPKVEPKPRNQQRPPKPEPPIEGKPPAKPQGQPPAKPPVQPAAKPPVQPPVKPPVQPPVKPPESKPPEQPPAKPPERPQPPPKKGPDKPPDKNGGKDGQSLTHEVAKLTSRLLA